MVTSLEHTHTSQREPDVEAAWRAYYPSLWSFVRHLVYSFRVPSWNGQEDDIAEDVLQETAHRLVERTRRTERGEASPIIMFRHMAVVIARNYCIDMRRQDKRLARNIGDDTVISYNKMGIQNDASFSEEATERVYQVALFQLVAEEIVTFPDKQRQVLLNDLANRMCFEQQPTPLQEAFLKVGIRLQDYQQPLPNDPKEHTRYTSLLYHAYKRIAQLTCVQQYISIA